MAKKMPLKPSKPVGKPRAAPQQQPPLPAALPLIPPRGAGRALPNTTGLAPPPKRAAGPPLPAKKKAKPAPPPY